MNIKIGLDIGSTTIKTVVLDETDRVLYKSYERHLSRVREMALEKMEQLRSTLEGHSLKIAITGSAGLGVAKESGIDFVQEVFATAGAVKKYVPGTDVVIELGGEDAKIIFLKGALEERMKEANPEKGRKIYGRTEKTLGRPARRDAAAGYRCAAFYHGHHLSQPRGQRGVHRRAGEP